jgi:hypothetical protein
VVEQPIRNRQVVGSTPTLGSSILLFFGFRLTRYRSSLIIASLKPLKFLTL